MTESTKNQNDPGGDIALPSDTDAPVEQGYREAQPPERQPDGDPGPMDEAVEEQETFGSRGRSGGDSAGEGSAE